MEQRSLRLGDIVDDYCPRERRVTNHAIVAIVENVVRQTRCSTCDAEHEYKEAKVPKKKTKPVLVHPKSDEQPAAVLVEAEAIETVEIAVVVETEVVQPVAAAAPDASDTDDVADEQPRGDVGMHRPLIRATLPRVEGGEPPTRPIPEFTMHQRHGRGFGGGGGGRNFRHGFSGNGNGSGQFRSHNQNQNNNHNHNPNAPEPDGNRASQPGRPGGGGGRRRRRRRR